MERSETELRKLGTAVRDLLAHQPATSRDLRQVRNDLIEELAGRESAPVRRRRRWPVVLAAAVLAAGAVVLWWRSPLQFQVGVAAAPGQVGDLVQATQPTPETLRFSDGSSVLLHEDGQLRVLATEAQGARVLVEEGTVDVHVVPAKLGTRRWSFEAGAFHVQVTGTTFSLSYRASDQHLSLSTHEGQVIVSGACLRNPASVTAGARLEWDCPVKAPIAASPPDDLALAVLEEGAAASLTEHPPRDGSWRVLLASGRLRPGLRAAMRVGFEHVCQVATSKELAMLADAARLFDRTSRAAFALRVLRQRFPATPASATAAFTLGRIAFEHKRAYGEAVEWFATYLSEQPNGPLMGDASGRLMEAKLAAGDHLSARADAEHYLRRFPEGPYAAEARRILSR